jgi:hypothetical protein
MEAVMSEGNLEQEVRGQEATPQSLDEVISGLKGFGIEEFEEILTIDAGGKVIKLRVSNIPTEDEMLSLMAVEGSKGYLWVQKVKVEILSRSISWVNGVQIRGLEGVARNVVDPTDGARRDIQVVLRNILAGWGQEVLQVLWKVVCVHCQRIEDRLVQSFPDSAIMTEVEKRFMDQAIREIADQNKSLIADGFNKLVETAAAEEQALANETQEPAQE